MKKKKSLLLFLAATSASFVQAALPVHTSFAAGIENVQEKGHTFIKGRVIKNIPRYESSVFQQDSYRGILLMTCMKDRFSRNENPSLLFTMPPVYQQSLASCSL